MPRDLFGDVTRPSISIGNRKWYTVPVSLLSHFVVVAAVVVVPLMATDVLPAPFETIDSFIVVKPVVPPPPPPPAREKPIVSEPIAESIPFEAPNGISDEPPEPPRDPVEGPGDSVILGRPDVSDIITPPPPPKSIAQEPVRAGIGVRIPVKTRDVQPVYPAMARAAGIQGVVIIEATIGIDGRLVNARVLRSLPLLDQAALEAVRQWEFTPSLLNGVPVPVIMTVTVNFTLTR